MSKDKLNLVTFLEVNKALKRAVKNSNELHIQLQEIVFMTNKFVNENNFTYDNGAIHEHTAEVKFIHELVTFLEENVIHCAMNNNYK